MKEAESFRRDGPFKAVTRVQIPLGTPDSDAPGERDRYVTGVGGATEATP